MPVDIEEPNGWSVLLSDDFHAFEREAFLGMFPCRRLLNWRDKAGKSSAVHKARSLPFGQGLSYLPEGTAGIMASPTLPSAG
ncbi:MAG: hypothetical protein WA970_18320 [Gammaproteobacteria bacterium]